MKIEKNYFLFKTLRVILDDHVLRRALKEKKYSYISGLSYDGNLANGDSSVRVKTKKTIVLDCQNKSDDEIIAGFRDTTRNEVRRTFSMSEFTCVVPDKNTDALYALYKDFESAGKRIVRSKRYFAESVFAGAYIHKKLVAAIMCYDAKPVLRVNAIVSLRKESTEERKYVSFATRRLVFELMRFARDHGYKTLDLGGINEIEEAKQGITGFKKSFGGEIIDEYTYTYKSTLVHYAHSLFHKR